MDEQTWLAAPDPRTMAEELRARGRLRVLRYFGCHCCRQARTALTDVRSLTALEVTEQYLIGRATRADYETAIEEAERAHQDARTAREALLATPVKRNDWTARARSMSASLATHLVHHAMANGYYDGMYAHIRDSLAFAGVGMKTPERTEILYRMRVILRELAGNPFRPVAFAPAWRTDTAVALAAQMYESRDFSATPILADALQDAGCDADDILNHLRDPHAAHLRGCWVLEMLLAPP